MMNSNSTIMVTGAAGFIGSCLVSFLNQEGITDLILVDDFSCSVKFPNLEHKLFKQKIEREDLFKWLSVEKPSIDGIFHIGARTDTTEFDYTIHQYLNVEYSQKVWDYCSRNNVPLVYASSAATYGSGKMGYKDDHEMVYKLEPLNAYGVSKNEFDKWALKQKVCPPFWAGLKFFNVYGPNEYHKRRMASVIFHSFNQIRNSGKVKLFKSHRPDVEDGEQMRDFIYVKDIIKVSCWLMQKQVASGLYNLGTGKARSFADLAFSTYAGLGLRPSVEYINMPEDICNKYQYFTQADMQKLINAGYTDEFYTLEKGIDDYVRNYLAPGKYY